MKRISKWKKAEVASQSYNFLKFYKLLSTRELKQNLDLSEARNK